MMNNIWHVFSLYLIDFLKLWLMLWGIIRLPAVKKKSNYAITGITEAIILIIASFYYKTYENIIISILTAMVVFTACVIFEGNFFKKIAYALLAYICVAFLDVCITGFITLISNTAFYVLVNKNLLNFICNSINIITLGIIILIKKIRNKHSARMRLSKQIYALLFAGAGTGIIIIGSLMVTSIPEASERLRKVMLIITIITCLCYSIACLMLVIITESRDNFKSLSQINQNVIESQQRYYMLVHEKQQEIRSIRHEMKNHFACINALNKANKLQEMDLYISQLIEQSENLDDLFDTGNDIVNAILNDAESRYKKQGIEIRLEGGFPNELNIASMDLCIIFANAVNNAVEAIQQMELQTDEVNYIDIKISSFKDELYIDISNPISKQVEMPNGKLITSKTDKNAHGFGTKNMIQRVQKYRGEIEFKSNFTKFFVKISLKNGYKN